MSGLHNDHKAGENVRPPAVAGSFYSEDPSRLRSEIQQYLADGTALSSFPKLLISPHAGYIFSGPVAAKGYAIIDPEIKRVIIIGPSHHQYFRGIALPEVEYYQTPLGKVRIDSDIISKMKSNPFVSDVKGTHTPEHSIEVQIPFLQVKLKEFSIIPVLVGKADPHDIASLLLPFIDSQTLVIASSDLSHYEEQAKARQLDDATIRTILSGSVGGTINGCGEIPVKIVMDLAERLNLQPVKLDARTSFETAPQFGSRSRVVGYASIAYITNTGLPGSESRKSEILSKEYKSLLLKIARGSLLAAVERKKFIFPESIPERLKKDQGCFVTLTVNGVLRGCIGYIEPIMPIYQAVAENARNAALQDPRFSPVESKELSTIQIEVSLLTVPEILHFESPEELLRKLRPEIDGVILQKGPYQSTFLPQVWEKIPDKVSFLQHLSLKGGMGSDGWKSATVRIYQAQHFEE